MGYDQAPAKKPKWFPKFEASLPRMEGKIVVITGTTSGTGIVAAKTCAKLGATVVCLNRPSQRANAALEQIKEEVPDADIQQLDTDLMDFDKVRDTINKIKSKFDRIDVLCCNAGVMAMEDKATKDGYDVQMQTNHLSHFLLVKELLPLLEKAAEVNGEARVVNHSSGARSYPVTPLKAKYFQKKGGNLGGNGNNMLLGGARWQRYHQTKLANSVFTKALARKLEAKGSKIKVLCAHPGLAATDLQVTTNKDGGMGGLNFLGGAGGLMSMSQSKEDGAMGILTCMCVENVKSGSFYGPSGATGPAKRVGFGFLTTKTAEKILWRESEAAVGEFKL